MKLCILANQILGDKISSGGDALSFEVFSRINFETVTIGSLAVRKAIKEYLPKTKYLSSDNSLLIPQTNMLGGLLIIFLYLYRTYKSIIISKNLEKIDGVYLTGDFICNSFVAAFIKWRQPNIKIFSNFYHLNPNPNSRKSNNFIFSHVSQVAQRISLNLIRKNSDLIFVLSEHGKEILLRLKFDSKRIFISGGGVDKKQINEAPLMKKNYDALFLGRLNRTKGIYDLVKILSIIHKLKPDFKLAIVGKGSPNEIDNLNHKLKENDLVRNVSYLGFVTNKKKFSLMKSIPVLILPSHEEGFSLVIMEALACGMHVCTYDLDVIKDIFIDYSEFIEFSPENDYEDVADNILMSSVKNNKVNLKLIPSWETIANDRENKMKQTLHE